MTPGMPERRIHDYLRNCITSLLAASNGAYGIMIGELYKLRAIVFKRYNADLSSTDPLSATTTSSWCWSPVNSGPSSTGRGS
jgi:hypothetical protein